MGCLCRCDSPFGLTAPKFVSPYRISGRRGKNDAADAAAICEAVTRPNMRFVPVKEEHQQIILCLHRTRQGFVEERTAIYNRIRGLISEFGIERRGYWRAVVAIAAKNARLAWAVLKFGEDFRLQPAAV